MTFLELYNLLLQRLADGGIEAAEAEAEAALIIGHFSGLGRSDIFLYSDRCLSATVSPMIIEALEERLRTRRPLAYILGEQEFWGRSFAVSEAVLVPRPETEVLIEEVLRQFPAPTPACGPQQPLFLDLGTGSGIIAVTLALELPWMRGLALDLEHSALILARENAHRLGAEGLEFIQADWHSAFIREQRFSLVTANPPYVAAEVMGSLQPELRHEPLAALNGGKDGIEEIKRLTNGLPEIISPGGWFFMEIGYDQEDYALQLFKGSKYERVMIHRDYAGLPRVLQAQVR